MALTKVKSEQLDAAQTSITSVGTLTGLTVSGDLTVDTSTLVVDSTNNRVGIGTSSPSFPLHVSGSSTNYVMSETTGTGTSSGFRLKGDASADFTLFTTQGTNQFAIYDNANSAERMRIDSSGRVGIGTSSPSSYPVASELVVDTGVSGGITVVSDSTSGGYGGVFFADGTTGNEQYRGFIQYNHNNGGSVDGLLLGTSGAERMRINSSGNVGIGTDNPLGKFVVSNGGAEGFEIFPGSASGQNSFQHYNRSGSAYLRNRNIASEFTFNLSGATDDAVTFKSNGNVGIGTTSPNAKLEVKGSGGGTGLALKTTDASSNEVFYVQDGGRVGLNYWPLTVGIPSGTAAATNAKFQVEEAGLLTVLTNGNVGIGTTNPRYNLNVAGNNSTAIGIGVDNASGSSTLDIAALGTGYNLHQAAAGEVWFYSPDNINIGGATGNTNDIKFIANNSINMRIRSSGVVTAPRQTYVQGRGSSGWSSFTQSWNIQPMGTPSMSVNRGTAYNTTTKRFTAPVDGVYLVIGSWYIYHPAASSRAGQYVHPAITVNGSLVWNGGQQPYTIFGHNNSDSSTTHMDGVNIAFTVYLSANDYVRQEVYSYSTNTQSYDQYHYFSYMLLH